jgi:predicted nucleic acid-binding protein
VNRVLLDADIFSEIFKQRDPTVAARAVAYQAARGSFTISVITAMEITSGLHRIQAAKRFARFESMLAGREVPPFDSSAALLAGRIDGELKRRGTTINLNDVMIAAIAIGATVPIVTGNTAHFEAVKSAGYPLDVENWRVQ